MMAHCHHVACPVASRLRGSAKPLCCKHSGGNAGAASPQPHPADVPSWNTGLRFVDPSQIFRTAVRCSVPGWSGADRPARPDSSLHFLHEAGRDEPVEYPLRAVPRNPQPLLQRADSQRNARVLNDPLDHALHDGGAIPHVPSF